jgi:hypothetical protein
MLFKKHSANFALGLGLAAALLSTGASAGAISGKADLVCASVNVVGCTGTDCMQGQAHTFELPDFMFVDVKRKLVHASNDSGEEVSSPIKNFEVTDDAIILQGIEDHRGWTLGIERDKGKMTLSSTGPAVSFMIFGNCTER